MNNAEEPWTSLVFDQDNGDKEVLFYNKIEEGMAYEEVLTILGEPTESKSIGIGPLSGTAATWDDGTTRISIKFLNEKVQLKSLEKVDGAASGG